MRYNCSCKCPRLTYKSVSIPPDSLTADRYDVCEGDGNITLTYHGGFAGTGAAANWYDDAGLTNLVGSGNNLVIPVPASSTKYYFTFEGSCNSTPADSVAVTVHPLPVVSFIGLNSVYDISDPSTTLIGSPAGGTFSGHGVSGNTYDPALAGVRTDTVVYSLYGCKRLYKL